jgi:ubiquinone/menaquinone biosynthesis C-methylase UbiE
VLEHLPDPRMGLAELARVLKKGGRMFLLTTEDNFSGAWTSRLWCCRTYNRRELMKLCESLGLGWKNELWFTKVHRAIRAGGICVEIEKT